MIRSLFARLAVLAVLLLAGTLAAMYWALTSFAEQRLGAPVDPAVRLRVLQIALAAAALALGITVLVSQSLTRKIRRLKRVAEGLAGTAPESISRYDPNDDLGSLERSLTGGGRASALVIACALNPPAARRFCPAWPKACWPSIPI